MIEFTVHRIIYQYFKHFTFSSLQIVGARPIKKGITLLSLVRKLAHSSYHFLWAVSASNVPWGFGFVKIIESNINR